MPEQNLDQSSPSPGSDEQTDPHQQVIQDLFAGQLTDKAAAFKLATITVPDPNIDPEECEEDLQSLWDVILLCLIKAPERVETVANLISCISRLPPPLNDSGQQLTVNEGGQRVWDDTPTLGWSLREEWEFDLSKDNGDSKRQATIDRFVMINILIGRLMSIDEERFDYDNLTLYTFKSALEYNAELPEQEDPDFRICHILAAAQLVRIAGHIICRWNFEFESGPLIGDRGKGGPLWDGKHGFCKERWDLWKRRFFEVSIEEGLSDEVRSCAGEASEAILLTFC